MAGAGSTAPTLLVAGATGAGKASVIWGLIRAMFSLLQAGLVRLLGADPKRMELSYGREIFDAYGCYAADPADIAAMLARAVADMQDRADRLGGKQRDHTPTVEFPFVVIVVDEVAFLTAYHPDKGLRERIKADLATLDHAGPGRGVLRGRRAARPAQGRHVHPQPVPRPDRHAAGRTRAGRHGPRRRARDRGAAAELISSDPALGAGVAFVRLEDRPRPGTGPRRLGPDTTSAPWPSLCMPPPAAGEPLAMDQEAAA